jgi:HPt (histidine-containing phosphotransfer) domain-containing protein
MLASAPSLHFKVLYLEIENLLNNLFQLILALRWMKSSGTLHALRAGLLVVSLPACSAACQLFQQNKKIQNQKA